MDKAVNYLQVFWKQLFIYLNDGRYDIDNSIAERFIRPLRVNARTRYSLLAIAWQTYRWPIISTINVPHEQSVYIRISEKIFHEIVKGRRDYGNFLLATI